MNTCTLTEKQQDMLLEMCRALFPEYKHISFDNQDLDIGSPYGYEINQFRKSNHVFFSQTEVPHDDGIFIHWFELCMTHLSELVLGKQIPRDIQTNYKTFAFNCFMYIKKSTKYYIHPVDYLYEQFKKLKDV